MKKIFLTCLMILAVSAVNAQDKNKSVSFEVKGNCGMCQKRIETAAVKMKGVKFASWNKDTKEFKAIMDENKCTVDDIKEKIASVGHDSEGFTAPKEVYDKLPACCKYRDPNSIHMDHGKH